MRFIDEATITIKAGHGGAGSVSFRREKFIPRGGPDGGDGGRGGDVVFMATVQMGTLQDFRYRRTYRAADGKPGSGAHKTGRDGEDIEIRIPVGTVIKDEETGETLVDFTEDGQRWTACKGGRGGKGNAHFVSSTFQAPKFSQPGEDGQEKKLKLELKLIADAAIIGFPNAGKSTLISAMSAAKPKIADYEFTTLSPNLGVVSSDDRSFVVADIPGLIEGAHRGAGLGHKFLKHIERTRLFVHLLDGTRILELATKPHQTREEGVKEAVAETLYRYKAIREELRLFNEALVHKPEILVLNKLDVLESDPELVESIRKALRSELAQVRGTHPLPEEPFIVSAATRTGVQGLIRVLDQQIDEHKKQAQKKARAKEGEEETVPLPDDEQLRAKPE